MRKVPGIDRLVVRPRPKEGESCTGYLIRVTEANAYPNLAFIVGHADGNIGGFTKVGKEQEARQQWRALEAALDLPAGEFQRRWPRQTYTSDVWQPAPLGLLPLVKADYALGNSQVCPECLVEDGYCQALWELRYYTVCHRHRRLMVSHCGACGAAISVKRPTLRRCETCDAVLGVSYSAIPVESIAWAISDILAKGLAGQPASPSDYKSVDFPWHLVEDVFAVVDAIRMMGWLTEMRFKKWLAANQSAEGRQSQLCRTLFLFEEWPNSWCRVLELALKDRAQQKSTDRGRLFHHERCMLARDAVRTRFISQTFSTWLSEKYPEIWTLKAFRPLAAKWRQGPEVLSAVDAARLMGCKPHSVRWMVSKGLLISVPDVVGGYRVIVTKESVERARATKSTALNWTEARAILKCDNILIHDEWFRNVIGAEQVSRYGRLFIQRERIDWLFEQIAIAKTGNGIGPVVSLKQAGGMFARTGGSYASFLRWILNGTLPVCGFNPERGIRSLTFLKRDLNFIKPAIKRGP